MITIDLDTETSRILEVIAAGVAARCYVVGAMDPTFAAPADRDRRARRLAKASPMCAAEFLRGWVEHHPAPAEPLAWHRWLGGKRVEVAWLSCDVCQRAAVACRCDQERAAEQGAEWWAEA